MSAHFLGNIIKITLICAFPAGVLGGCNSQTPASNSDNSTGKAAAEAIKKPIDQSRDAEKQIFDSAERQKRQSEAF